MEAVRFTVIGDVLGNRLLPSASRGSDLRTAENISLVKVYQDTLQRSMEDGAKTAVRFIGVGVVAGHNKYSTCTFYLRLEYGTIKGAWLRGKRRIYRICRQVTSRRGGKDRETYAF